MDRCVLRQYRHLVAEIADLKQEADTLERRFGADDHGKNLGVLRGRIDGKIAELILIRDEIEKSMAGLSSMERRIIRMRYFGGKTNQYIAADLKMSLPSIKRINARALAKIEGRL